MPALSALTPLGRQILQELPGWAASEPLYRAAAHIWSKEAERMLARAEEVRDAAIPAREGALGIELWEIQLHLPRNPPGFTEPQRWEAILARLRRAIEDPSGLTWIARVTEQIGSGWTYVEEAPNIIKVTAPWPPGSDAFLFGESVLLEEIPAAWTLVYVSVEGFVLDASKLDLEELD